MLFIGRIIKFIGMVFVLLLVSSVISSIGFQVDVIPYIPAFFIFPILIFLYAGFKVYRKLA